MRALILVAGAALAVSACGTDTAENNMVVENLTAENLVVENDLNAMDANMMGNGFNMAWMVCRKWIGLRRSVISVSMKRPPSRNGRACASLRNSNGRPRRPNLVGDCGGSIPTAPFSLIPDIESQRARSVNTTASSCATRWYCVAVHALRIPRTYVQPTGIFSIPRIAGSSAVSALQRTWRERTTIERYCVARLAPWTQGHACRRIERSARSTEVALVNVLLR